MSLSPFFNPFYRNWWDAFDYPSRIMDQHFGMGLFDNDFSQPTVYRGYVIRPRTQTNVDSSGASEVVADKDKFQVRLNVKHFKPDEIEVKTVDNFVVVHGKHEEQTDEHGFISREFTRRYMLPDGVEPEKVTSSFSPNGILTVEAPRKAIEPPPVNERVVPISLQRPSEVEAAEKQAGDAK